MLIERSSLLDLLSSSLRGARCWLAARVWTRAARRVAAGPVLHDPADRVHVEWTQRPERSRERLAALCEVEAAWIEVH